jgi:hypothetical protein
MKNIIHKISIPFYIIGILLIAISFYYFNLYLQNLFEIKNYSNWTKVSKGATITHVTIDTRANNVFNGMPILNLIGSAILPGTTYIILVEYTYIFNGKTYTSRNYDLLSNGTSNKLNATIQYDNLVKSTVDYYINPSGTKTYLVLDEPNQLGLPWKFLIYLFMGLFLVYGGYLLPNLFGKMPEKIDNLINKKLGILPVEIDVGNDDVLSIA